MVRLSTSWERDHDGWRRGFWLVREAINSTPEKPVWEMCRKDAMGVWRPLDEGPTARGMMDHADISDGV